MKRKLLWIGHVLSETGFSRVTENSLAYLADDWDIAVLGVGFDGDPHDKPYRIYRADRFGDRYGVNRVHQIIAREAAPVVVILMEPWNAMAYIQTIRSAMRNSVKIVGIIVVDGENMKPQHAEWLSQLDCCVFPTEFALKQAKNAGFNGSWYVVPHGVDPIMYQPVNKQRARSQIGLGNILGKDAFVFGNVNENQPRKRLDLTIEAWARWWKEEGQPKNAYLYIHANKNSPVGWDLGQLATSFGIRGRIVAPAEDIRYGEASMKYVYNALDVQYTTTLGEGWGMTSHEGMACGVPQIVPATAALGEWAKDAAICVRPGRPFYSSSQQNVRGYEPNMDDLHDALKVMWRSETVRKTFGKLGRELVLGEAFRWSTVADGFNQAIDVALNGRGVSKTFTTEVSLAGPSGEGLKS
jgi:glycosyltransferase involved in cell wall biosynthesis